MATASHEDPTSAAPSMANGTENGAEPLSVPDGLENTAVADTTQLLPTPAATSVPMPDMADMTNGRTGDAQAISAGRSALTH